MTPRDSFKVDLKSFRQSYIDITTLTYFLTHNYAHLWDEDPDDAEPPELDCEEDRAEDVAHRAAQDVAHDVLDGVAWNMAVDTSLVSYN